MYDGYLGGLHFYALSIGALQSNEECPQNLIFSFSYCTDIYPVQSRSEEFSTLQSTMGSSYRSTDQLFVYLIDSILVSAVLYIAEWAEP